MEPLVYAIAIMCIMWGVVTLGVWVMYEVREHKLRKLHLEADKHIELHFKNKTKEVLNSIDKLSK